MRCCRNGVAPFFAQTWGHWLTCEWRRHLKVHQVGIRDTAHAEILGESLGEVHIKVSVQVVLHLGLLGKLQWTAEPRA